MKRWSVATAILLLAFAVVFGVRTHLQNTFTVVNQTGQALRSARVDVCGQIFELGIVRPGGHAWRSFKTTRNSSYNVTATLWDGRTIQGSNGYVTLGSNGKHDRIMIKGDLTFVVRDNGIWH